MQRSRRSPRTVVLLDPALGNSEVACLVEAPLLEGAEVEDLVLTSDEWSRLLAARRQAARPLHWVEGRDGAEEQGRHQAMAGGGVEVAQGADGVGRVHAGHRAPARSRAA